MVVDPGASSITVAVRVRPFTIREAAQLVRQDDSTLFLGDGSLAGVPTPKLNQKGVRSVIKVMDERCLVFDPPEDNPVQKFSRSVVPTGKKVKDQVFAFDRVFDDNTSQMDVYEGTTKTLLDSVLDGYNATVFAYGATGCGKTHTITGTSQQPGIIFLTMQELFEKISERSQDKTTELSLSYLEIYNETIRDLLVPGGSKQGLMLREDANQAVSVSGLTSHHPRDVQEVMDMIVQGNEYRTVSPTAANATSSRSHAVLQINVAQKDRNADVNEPHTMATLSIIDLAGSERASATKNRGERLIEGANINKSLLALGSCINALCDPRKRNHVPYRNSKLTRLLKFSLGGNCKTVMIVCVSPSSVHFDETQNTLRYANRAKNIQTKVTRNVFNVNRHVKDFLVKIDEQMALINELRNEQKDAEKIFFAKFRKQLEKRECTAREGIQRLRQAYDNSADERQTKIADMKRLKTFERRIGLLSAWIASFDTVCDAREDEDAMPPNLSTMRKTAQGILVELEHSRQHIHQKLDKSHWERTIDTALQHSMAQLSADGGDADSGEISTLTREAELLKSNFTAQAYREVLDHEKSGDAGTMQALLTAQFEILTSLSETMAMDEEEAVGHAKEIINRLLETGFSAASHVIKPDGSLSLMKVLPPSRRGTPKRKKAAAPTNVQPVPVPALVAMSPPRQQPLVSPTKSSPRRRKIAPGRKGVTFTPVKKKSPTRRSVRWRDDETEEGTLADFEKTPQKINHTPEANSSPDRTMPPVPVMPPYLSNADSGSDSSPSLLAPEAASLPTARPNRFQAGFLTRGVGATKNGSPRPPAFSLNLSGSSDTDERPSPLRDMDVHRTSNIPSPRILSFKSPVKPVGIANVDENTIPTVRTTNAYGSEDDNIDTQKLRSALHSAKRQTRISSLGSNTSLNAKRISSTGSISGRVSSHRVSASYSGPPASSTNGISRQRRSSAERRRSPPISCSPLAGVDNGSGSRDGGARAFTPSQARRMNLSSSVRLDNSGAGGSPSERAQADAKARRVTIASAAATAGASAAPAIGGSATRGRDTRSGVIWR